VVPLHLRGEASGTSSPSRRGGQCPQAGPGQAGLPRWGLGQSPSTSPNAVGAGVGARSPEHLSSRATIFVAGQGEESGRTARRHRERALHAQIKRRPDDLRIGSGAPRLSAGPSPSADRSRRQIAEQSGASAGASRRRKERDGMCNLRRHLTEPLAELLWARGREKRSLRWPPGSVGLCSTSPVSRARARGRRFKGCEKQQKE
jgi:hypothetical protein